MSLEVDARRYLEIFQFSGRERLKEYAVQVSEKGKSTYLVLPEITADSLNVNIDQSASACGCHSDVMIISQGDNGQNVTNSATQQGSIVENGVQAHNTNQRGHFTLKVQKTKVIFVLRRRER